MSIAVYLLGIALQLTAGIIAIFQVRIALNRLPWLLIALSSILIVARRAGTIGQFIREDRQLASAEVLTLIISLLFFLGVLLMSQVFRSTLKIQNALRENENKLQLSAHYSRSLIEVSLDPLVTISAQGVVTDVNAATEKITGLPREKLIGSNFSSYFTEPERATQGYQLVFESEQVIDYPLRIRHQSGALHDVLYNASVYRDESGKVAGVFAAARDITLRKELEASLQKRVSELQDALSQIQTLRGILPICSRCKKIRSDDGYWQQVEVYVREHSNADFSHGLCPECMQILYPGVVCRPFNKNSQQQVE